MWTRSLLKTNAKNVLRSSYWKVFAVCLLGALLGALPSSTPFQTNFNFDLEELERGDFSSVFPATESLNYISATVFAGAVIIGLIFAMLVVLFVSIPLQVGICRYMMENRQGATPFGTVFSAFSVQYLHTVGVLFTTNLLIVWPYLVTIALALLSSFTTPLLLILMVPCLIFSLVYAINRGYSWYLVPWLLAENPYLTADRARQLSRDMTMGDKWNIFVLELSFIGWDILASLLFGLGHFFLNPYKQATFAELYAAMRAKAMAAGYSNEQELAGFVRHPMM